MPEFPKPNFPHTYDVGIETARLRAHRVRREVPRRPKTRLAIASWNIANLGAQDRRYSDHALMAEMISWFDLVALQEVREDLSGLRAIQRHLSSRWRALFTDRAGNDERLTYLYRSDRHRPRELIGEVNLLPAERRKATLPEVAEPFTEFNRSPFLCSFVSGELNFTLANVHVYFGAASGAKFQRRRLEVLALATYARLRQRQATRYDAHLMLIGDFNTPKAEATDKVYKALLEAGLVPPDELHGTAVGGNAYGFHHAYDQLVMFPNTKQAARAAKGVFDFDTVVFPDLWHESDRLQQARCFGYPRYYLSDHRILWASFDR